ncbi:MAG: amidohydrolase [Solobacterium sp.]|nr:amidohydrolase [Solobacterium sp.]
MKKEYEEKLAAVAKGVWDHPEAGFLEFESSRIHVDFLRSEGFEIEENVADTVTGYVAKYGSGHPVIALLGEFDALYGLGQKADVAEYAPDGCEMGHGCGHHLLGAGVIGAGLLIRDYLKEHQCSGTVLVCGCPAEESGSGKAYMARDGVFNDTDIALAWHPGLLHQVGTGSSQSCIQTYFRFHGIASHAAGSPQAGRSALDAVELMDVGVNYLREHMESTDRVHYAITNSGGKSPNVVQAEAEVKYLIRSTSNPKCLALYERVCNIARGAALMTGTTMEIVFDEGLSNTIVNFTLEKVMQEAFREVGVPEYTEEELAYAKKFRDSWPHEFTMDNVGEHVKDKRALLKNMQESPICSILVENECSDVCHMGSTDVGDVSWVVPTESLGTACYSYGAGAHSRQWVAQGKSSIAMKGIYTAAEVLARTAEKLLEDTALIEEAKEEFKDRTAGMKYECLIPADVKPHVIS